MASLRLLLLTPTLFCLLNACTVSTDDPNGPASTQAAAGEVGGTSGVSPHAASSKNDAQAGSAGRKASQGGAGKTSRTEDESTGTKAETTDPEGTDRESAGSNSGGAGPTTAVPSEPALPPSCDLDGSCISEVCQHTSGTCGIESNGTTCEFEGFKGATVEVACGQRAVVGMACCGGCGCVPIEVYFDGTHCWQGFPQCEMDQFRNKMVDPHPPTTPNPGYVPPDTGTFYLGSGGFGGSGAVGGAAGMTSGAAGTAGGGRDAVSGAAGEGGAL